MGFLKKVRKAVKKVRGALGLPAITLGNVAKVGGALAVGGPLAAGAAVLKSKLKSAAVGGIKQVVRAKAQKAQLRKIGTLAPPKIVGISSAVTMPGGAPLRGVKVKRAKAAALPKAKRAKRAKRVAPKANGAKRKAPPGGKDFKQLSASWNAAGKPGKWIDWVKSH